jgi:hypothetical protein
VCLCVIYAFGHGTSKYNKTLQGISFRPGKGRRVVFDRKYSPGEGGAGIAPPIFGFTTVNAFSRSLCTDCFSIIRERMSKEKDTHTYTHYLLNYRTLAWL